MKRRHAFPQFAKTIITSCALMVILSTGYSQKITIGVKSGFAFSQSVFGDKDDKANFNNRSKLGFITAGLVNFPLKDNYSFQTEFGYSQRGRKVEFNQNTWFNNATYHYLDGTMLLRKSYPLNWTKNVKGTWFVNIGPRISYWLSGKGKVIAGGSYTYQVKFTDPPDEPSSPDFNIMYMRDVNRWLFGLDFGIGADAPTTALQRFVFEVRFTSGHTFYGSRDSAFNRTLGFVDNLRANEKMLSFTASYTLNRDLRESKKGKSTKNKEIKKAKPRKNFNSKIR
jgi:hypothetical protein